MPVPNAEPGSISITISFLFTSAGISSHVGFIIILLAIRNGLKFSFHLSFHSTSFSIEYLIAGISTGINFCNFFIRVFMSFISFSGSFIFVLFLSLLSRKEEPVLKNVSS